MKRAYSMSQWTADFTRAFAASVPVASVATQARGHLLAADNDEDALETRAWPMPSLSPIKSFKAIDDECSAEQRRIVRGIVARHQSDSSAVSAHHMDEMRSGLDHVGPEWGDEEEGEQA